MAEAEGYFYIGEKDKAEVMFSDLQKGHPDSIWIYCRWGDLYVYSRDRDFVPDYEKSEKIYRMALDHNLDPGWPPKIPNPWPLENPQPGHQ